MRSQLQSWVILEWMRHRSLARNANRHRTEIGDATVYLCRTPDASDTMTLRVEPDGEWALHTSRCVIWCDGTHRAVGSVEIERDRLCGNAIEAIDCYYDARDMRGIE